MLILLSSSHVALGVPSLVQTQKQDIRYSEVSSRKSFRIEEIKSNPGEDSGYQLWAVAGKERKMLPPFPTFDGASDESVNDIQFSISPNEKWVFCTQKVYHRFSSGALYERTGRVSFRLVFPKPFDEVAWSYLKKRYGKEPEPGGQIIDFPTWSSDGHRVLFRLRAVRGYTAEEGYGWTGYYDTVSRKFGTVPRRLHLQTEWFTGKHRP